MSIDFSKAPDGAEYYIDTAIGVLWYKVDADLNGFHHNGSQWVPCPAGEGKWLVEQGDKIPAFEPVRSGDNVNSPAHYNSGSVECIEAIKASMSHEAFMGYLKGNVQKYLWRFEKKANPVEDLRKAQWYLARLVEEQEAPQPQMSYADRQAWLADVVAAGEAEMTKAQNALREKLRAPRK